MSYLIYDILSTSTFYNLHSVTSNAVAQMFNQTRFHDSTRFEEEFYSSDPSVDSDRWWRVFQSTYGEVYYSNFYIEITVVNTRYAYNAPNVTKYIVSPQYQTSPNPAVIQICKSNSSCHGIRVGRDSNNNWFVDLHLWNNTYIILAQGINFKRSAKIENPSTSGFAYVSQIDN